jgi:hypothetical protein
MSKCNDLIMQELPNLVNTKLSEERKQFLRVVTLGLKQWVINLNNF